MLLGDIAQGIVEDVFCECGERLWKYLRGAEQDDDSGRPRHRPTLPTRQDESTRQAAYRRMRERRDTVVPRRRPK